MAGTRHRGAIEVRCPDSEDRRAETRAPVVAADPDDDRIVECAVAGNADLIVSSDHHLTKLKEFRGIGIVRPMDFRRTLGV